MTYQVVFDFPKICDSASRVDATGIMIVEAAAIVGSTRSGNALTSSKEIRNDSTEAVFAVERISGSVTSRKVRKREAPKLQATVSWLTS